MAHCEHCRERLFDYLFGLLEGAELETMRAHVAVCTECQAELARANSDSKLMARAARAISVVPEFTLPGDGAETTPAAPEAPSTLPISAPSGPKPVWRRPWVVWSTAAAVLLALGASISYHRHESETLRAQVKAARGDHQSVELEFAALPAKYTARQAAALAELRTKAAPYFHIVGPSQMQPNARGHLHVTTLNSEGVPVATGLRMQLVEAQSGNIVQATNTQSDPAGQAHIELNASGVKANSNLNVIVTSEGGATRATVQNIIRVKAPTYVTRVDTNKAIYQINDVLFFRVLVLDRYSLLPPVQPILVRVALKDPKNEVVASLDLATSEGGIVAREFPIASKFLAGIYTLTVDSLDPAQTAVQSAAQRIEVVRDILVPDVQLDHDRYFPGEIVTGVVRSNPSPDSAKLRFGNGPQVDVTLQPEAHAFPGLPPIPMIPAAKSGKKGEKKATQSMTTASRFEAPIPKDVAPGAAFLPFTLELATGKQKTEYRGVVPLEPTDYDIEFFPEGGDLVAGVQNRVYYRVRSKSGEPVTSDGSVILMTGRDIIDSPYKLGLGYLDFTPESREKYTVRITTPMKTSVVEQPFARLPIRPTGVVLHVPTAVAPKGDPIRLTLRNQGPVRKLLLVAQCRGQIVDQAWVDVKAGSQDFLLQPAPDARGMIKVTAYEVSSGPRKPDRIADALVPIAERLVYRSTVQRLELGLDLNTQQPLPGKTMRAKLTARTEQGDAASAWFLAAVVDDRFISRSRSLSAHFMLLNEIRTGSELEDAQVILHDAPESAQMLERFLGTHGWRRFIPTGQPGPATPIVFSRESVPLERMLKEYDAAVVAALTPLRTAAFLEEAELRDRRTHSFAAVMMAVSNLQQFEERVQLGIRLSLGILLAALLLASLILMGIGAYRIARQNKRATPAFSGAFACLALYIGIWFAGQALGSMASSTDVPQFAADPAWQVKDGLDKQLAMKAGPRAKEMPPAGSFFQDAAPPAVQPAVVQIAPKQAPQPANVGSQTTHEQLTRSFVRRTAADRPSAVPNEDQRLSFFRDRASSALKGAKDDVNPVPIVPKTPPNKTDSAPPTAPNPGNPPDGKKAAEEIEYGYRHVPGLHADTLLWHPALWLTNGTGEIRFDIAAGQASYRILLLGHTTTGRFGFHESRLDVLPVGR
jgi:hypothetical protein